MSRTACYTILGARETPLGIFKEYLKIASLLRDFLWGLGEDGEGVEPGLQLVSEGVVDHAVAINQGLAVELGGDDLDVEVSLPVGAAGADGGVASVLAGDVLDLEEGGVEGRLELGFDPLSSG